MARRKTKAEIKQHNDARDALERSFRAAVKESRKVSEQGVQEVLDTANQFYSPAYMVAVPHSHILHMEAVFDGLLSALADAIIANAEPGFESGLAESVADRLVMTVESKTCAGRA